MFFTPKSLNILSKQTESQLADSTQLFFGQALKYHCYTISLAILYQSLRGVGSARLPSAGRPDGLDAGA
jgi:hypothetical protein